MIKNVLATFVIAYTLMLYVKIIVIVMNMCEKYADKYIDYYEATNMHN
jgi:hypothetical protein